MEKLVFSRLGTNSKRAFLKAAENWPSHDYRPKGLLLDRLSRETGMTPSECYNQLLQEIKETHQDLDAGL